MISLPEILREHQSLRERREEGLLGDAEAARLAELEAWLQESHPEALQPAGPTAEASPFAAEIPEIEDLPFADESDVLDLQVEPGEAEGLEEVEADALQVVEADPTPEEARAWTPPAGEEWDPRGFTGEEDDGDAWVSEEEALDLIRAAGADRPQEGEAPKADPPADDPGFEVTRSAGEFTGAADATEAAPEPVPLDVTRSAGEFLVAEPGLEPGLEPPADDGPAPAIDLGDLDLDDDSPLELADTAEFLEMAEAANAPGVETPAAEAAEAANAPDVETLAAEAAEAVDAWEPFEGAAPDAGEAEDAPAAPAPQAEAPPLPTPIELDPEPEPEPLELTTRTSDFLEMAAAANAAPTEADEDDGFDIVEAEDAEAPLEAEDADAPIDAASLAPPPAADEPPETEFEEFEVAEVVEEPSSADYLAPAAFASGEHRVVVHLTQGPPRRGRLIDADLEADVLHVWPLVGSGDPQPLPQAKVRAVFFLLGPGEKPPPADGPVVQVRFAPGREMRGYAEAAPPEAPGFFLVPDDAVRTNVGRIYVYRDRVPVRG